MILKLSHPFSSNFAKSKMFKWPNKPTTRTSAHIQKEAKICPEE